MSTDPEEIRARINALLAELPNLTNSENVTTEADLEELARRLSEAHDRGEVLTGLFYVNTKAPSFLDMLNMIDEPLATLPESLTRPGREALAAAMEELR